MTHPYKVSGLCQSCQLYKSRVDPKTKLCLKCEAKAAAQAHHRKFGKVSE